MMDIDQLQRKDIDDIQYDKVSLTIDEYNTLSSPFSLNLYDYMVDGYNWVKSDNKIIKYNLVENDKLIFHIDKVSELKEKYITNIKIVFDIDTGNNNFIFNGVNLIHDDIIKKKDFYVFMNNKHMVLDCGVFDYDDLDFIVNGKTFDIEFLLNGNKFNSILSIKNVKIVFEFIEKLQSEKDSVFNRIVDLIYPVGYIYMSVNNVSPSVLFGGEWERLKDTFLLAAGDVYNAGSEGGNADAIVVKHNHTQDSHNHIQYSHNHGFGSNSNYKVPRIENDNWGYSNPMTITHTSGSNYWVHSTSNNSGITEISETDSTTATNKETTAINQETGESGIGKNMPPYLSVYMWKRIR